MLAIQYELGMADGIANGNFGPGTRDGLKNRTLGIGSRGSMVSLFTAAMVFNRQSVTFSSFFSDDTHRAVRAFQGFCKLPDTGLGDFQTWASLLVSTGDPTRSGNACDCITTITPERADTLLAHGYTHVGRYLSESLPPDHPGFLGKAIMPGELQTIASKGLRCYPIYQTYGASASYFNINQGRADALLAVDAATHHGFRPGTRIFFAVDFDAMDHQVTESIIPYFRGVDEAMGYTNRQYRVGVYAPRNVCSRVRAEGLSEASFVCGMSVGFSGNLGYPLPSDWAYDQISTISIGAGAGRIEIDNNIFSGLDQGQSYFNPPGDEKLDVRFNLANWELLLQDVREFYYSTGRPEGGAGSDLYPPELWENTYLFSVKESLETIIHYDILLTSLARSFRMRKALVQSTVLWELASYNLYGLAHDAAVSVFHNTDIPQFIKDSLSGIMDWARGRDMREGSTGVGKIYPSTAIEVRNWCIRQHIIQGSIQDVNNDHDIWSMWRKLNQDNAFSMSQVPLIHIWGANDIGLRRPDLTFTLEETRQVSKRYQGTNDQAEEASHKRMVLYGVFEKYNSPERNL
jgi:peptidoglycan hydrolase-like protein with peptidoglycan-binding domain